MVAGGRATNMWPSPEPLPPVAVKRVALWPVLSDKLLGIVISRLEPCEVDAASTELQIAPFRVANV